MWGREAKNYQRMSSSASLPDKILTESETKKIFESLMISAGDSCP